MKLGSHCLPEAYRCFEKHLHHVKFLYTFLTILSYFLSSKWWWFILHYRQLLQFEVFLNASS